MHRKVSKALMMNTVQRVPYYRSLWWDHREDLLFFDPRGIDWERERIQGLLLHRGRWLQGHFAFPQTIYNRYYPQPESVIKELGGIIGGEHIFNDRTHFDKWEVYQQLKDSEVGEYLPPTYQYSEDDLVELLTTYPSFILKPRLGHGGAGVIKATLLSPNVLILLSPWGVPFPFVGQSVYVPLLTAIAPPPSFVAQHYIESMTDNNYKFDVRVMMQKNGSGQWEVGGQLSRVAYTSNLLTNHYYAIVPPHEVVSPTVISTLHALSHAVAEALDGEFATLGELGVDFLIDLAGRPWILEVNGKPDKSLFMQLNDKKMMRQIYLNPLQYQDHLLGT